MARRADSRHRIQSALFGLLEEMPLEKVTVSEVCDRACVSRTTYYRNYISLGGVMEDALDSFFADIESLVPDLSEIGSDEDQRVFEYSTYQILNRYKANADVLGSLLKGSASMTLQTRLYEFLLRMIDKAEGGNATEARTERIYSAAGMTGVICDWVRGGCETPTMDILDFIVAARERSA